MFTKIRVGVVAASSSRAMLAAIAPSAHAGLVSLATGPCGQQEYQPFLPWGDSAIGLLNNTIGSLTLGESTISFTFAPADSTGKWQIDDVYLDPFCRH